ncbi:MICAL-like protein 2a [Myripristis murdjan]|uniref:Mical-like 2a n=1 Tax=Myripristis murdjan TaxID=586833 RepID=A0A668AHR2_9TELE|nr:MICAL-like protein 2 [Myripristis murdjan]
MTGSPPARGGNRTQLPRRSSRSNPQLRLPVVLDALGRSMAAIKALEQWCKIQCEGYRDVAITNMTTSFRSGLAFCALIHKYRPDLIDYDSLSKEDVFKNNSMAFQIAEEKLGIPALLDAEDMVALRIPDRLSILTYVSQYYNYFNGRAPMGGVKRPAEGSKEEPSEKKNLPVVAKTFVSKTAIENRLPPTLVAQTSPKLARTATQKTVLVESSNKSGTLNSKCVACKSQVHLVQRHFVDGKLYHRSCFKCSVCSSVLHTGTYKAGKEPGTFICNSQNGCKSSSSEALIKKGPASLVARPNSASQPQPTPSASSVPPTPLNIVLKPVSPAAASHSWTASAQKTQAARQRFFQAAPPVAEAPAGNRKPLEPPNVPGRPKVALSPDEKSSAKATIGKKLAEENCNNNNKRLFVIRSAEKRFGDEPNSADSPSLKQDKCSQGSAGSQTGQSSTSQTNNKKSPCVKPVNKDSTRPTTVYTNAKDPGHRDSQTKLKPVQTAPGLRNLEAEAGPATSEPGFISTPSSNMSFSATKSLSAATPEASPVSFPLFDPTQLREVPPYKPQPGSGNQGLKPGSRSSIKSPPRWPAVESAGSSTAVPANYGNPLNSCPSGAKKGKYLSPTNASRTEMRSPSIMSHHIPVDQIEKELSDIERNLSDLEREGVELEEKLRRCEEEGEGDILMDPLMVDWFNLIRKKQMYVRKESELVYIARTQDLEEQQPGVEGELRRLLEKPDHLKSKEEQQREKRLMARLVEIVDGRNAIVEVLDEDRLREVEEDQQLNQMMQNLGVKRAKNKRKSSISKLFRRRSKRLVE